MGVARGKLAASSSRANAIPTENIVNYAAGTLATPNTGYFGGGRDSSGPGTGSTVDRIDYSNDTATASPKGPLTNSARDLSATGNASFLSLIHISEPTRPY